MLSPDRRRFLSYALAALAGAPLAACGFTPAYGPSGPTRNLQGAIRAADPNDKRGFDFVERLEERLGNADHARYDLSYTIDTHSLGVGITADNSITRYNLRGSADWRVIERATGKQVTAGRAQSFTSWSATSTTIAGITSAEDASYRLMRILADQVVTQLVATSASWLK